MVSASRTPSQKPDAAAPADRDSVPRIEVADLTVRYGDTVAVNGVSFRVARGQQLALLGPSGCGKTAILRAVAGLEQPASGRIRMDGALVHSRVDGVDVPAEERGISMVFQSYAIWPHMSVFDNVAYGLRVRKLGPKTVAEKVDWALGLMHMQEYAQRSASKLSGGQQQRVALARAIAFSPNVLLLDNPLSNLDARLRVEMRVELRELQQALALTSIYVTHDQEEAFATSDQVIVMNRGRIEQIGTPEEIYNAPRNRFVAAFVGAANIIPGQLHDGARDAGRVVFDMAGGVTLQARAPHGFQGDERQVAVRTAYIALKAAGGPDGAGAANQVAGRVRRRLFHGDFIQYLVEWPAGELVVRRPPTDLFEEGTPILVSFSPEHCILLSGEADQGAPQKRPQAEDRASGGGRAGDGPRIEVSDLVVRYGSTLAVNGVSFSVRPGEQLALLGPSGCGKTSTLRAIAGLEQPSSGRICIDGKPVYSSADRLDIPTEKRGISMVFQSFAVWPHMSVFDNVAYGLRGRGLDQASLAKKVEWALMLVHMEEHASRSPVRLSGGQQQRVALARAIVYSPDILLFDEPLSNMDARLRAEMRVELRDLQKTLQLASVYVTHDQEEAFAISDRVIVMNEGVIEQIGRPEEIYSRPRNRFVANFVGAANLIAGRVRQGGRQAVAVAFELPGGMSLDARAQHAPRGDETQVAVRTTHITLAAPGGASGPNAVQGKVRRRLFHGDFIQYQVEWPAGELTIRRPPTDVFEEGEAVVVSFAPEHCILLEK
ncbi:MAG TPA: ABC transporter ATP-binding protein [Candidatus Sulfotelmatobacter sp.]|nr:ABC transporter ATP-binding protein [Candidatus Sulfotelmatobacter sp.]